MGQHMGLIVIVFVLITKFYWNVE